MWSSDCFFIINLAISIINLTTDGASVALDIGTDYQISFDNKYNDHVLRKSELTIGNKEIRCYCNQPECVPQGYMCRGISGCFTKLPSQNAIIPKRAPASLFKPEHSVYNGCLVEREQCPPEFLCCNEDLCNHVDSPAVINRLNKTLRILLVGDAQQQQQQLQNQLHQPTQQEDSQQKPTIQIIKSMENYWFKTATIAICICGIVFMLILMSLAIRLLQPVFPMQTMDKQLGVHLVIENTPPLLLESPKTPLA